MTPRQRLLDAAVACLAEHGTSALSLRQLAAKIGTSHRMLIYHFESKEGLLVAVVEAMEAQQRELLDDLVRDPATPPDVIAHAFWQRLRDRALRPYIRLFFEMYAQATQGRPGTREMLDGVVDRWVEPLAAWEIEHGVPEQEARTRARLGLAATRGLLLDLVATGDEAGVDAAMEYFIATSTGVPVERGP